MTTFHDIGFIGTGIMGKFMLRNVQKAGFTMHCFARHPEKVADLKAEGVAVHPSIAELAKVCDCVITIVGFPKDVEEVYFGKEALFDSAKSGAYLVDMTTTSPTLAKRLYQEGKKKGFHVMDAPVTGGDTGAKNGTLSILAGGDAEDYETLLPVFKAMGTNINHMGAAGMGQHAKMANQIMIAGALSGVCEAFSYARANKLDLEKLLAAVKTGAAGSAQLNAYGEKMIQSDFAPGFFVKHFIKDMRLANQEAEQKGLTLPVLQQVLGEYLALEEEGQGNEGTQVLLTYYDKKREKPQYGLFASVLQQ